MVDYVRFSPPHLDGVLRLCAAEDWPSLPADPDRALRVLTAPGVTTVVAVERGKVVGFAELFSDGEIQAYLALIAVEESRRGDHIGRKLVQEALRLAGGERIDLLSEGEALGFYRSFPNFEKPGFRLYPFHEEARDT
jgi:ribosomal protein S18 acetylase RimI-like enzyme